VRIALAVRTLKETAQRPQEGSVNHSCRWSGNDPTFGVATTAGIYEGDDNEWRLVPAIRQQRPAGGVATSPSKH
jgi:hypothetical protein